MRIWLLAVGGITCPTWAAAQTAPVTVHDAVRLALEVHPRLAAAAAQNADALAVLGQTRAQRLPALSADASVVRFQEPMIIAPLHRFDPTRPPAFDETLVQSRWSVDYTLFDGGARDATIRGARAGVEASDAGLSEARMSVMEEVVNAYLATLSAREVDQAEIRRLDALENERRRVALLREQGRAAEVEVLRVQAALAQAQADRVRAREQLATAQRELARLTGAAAATVTSANLAPVRIRDLPPIELESETTEALAYNPALARARAREIAAQAGHRAARASWLPTLRMTGGYVTFGSVNGEFGGEWQGGVGLQYPIFTGGARRARVAERAAEVESAAAEIRLTELRTRTAVDQTISAVTQAEARSAALARAVAHLTEVARIERLALDVGSGVQTEYLRAEADLVRARAALAEAQHTAVAARVALARVTGALTTEWVADHLESRE